MDKSKETTECSNHLSTSLKKKVRPAQRLYVPPAQRNKKKIINNKHECAIQLEQDLSLGAAKSEVIEINFPPRNNVDEREIKTNICNKLEIDDNSLLTEVVSNNCASAHSNLVVNKTSADGENVQSMKCDESLMIMLGNMKVAADKVDVDVEQEEMERAIININRKSRPLIKHVNVGNSDVLHIDVDDKEIMISKSKKLIKTVDEQIGNWEDLFNEDDEFNGQFMEQIVDYIDKGEELSDEENCIKRNIELSDLEHVVELYDFPSTFKTHDLVQLYHDVNEESMYIKWCDETHALLVLSTPAQAKKALQIDHAIIKSRSMLQASLVAAQVASRCDLKPAMKRPQTNMQTARRLITSHLGTRSRLSKEEQQRERDELRKAKELKRALRQSENDAWDGHPRPSTV